MAFVTTNNLDDIAIYLGITRLPGETNVSFLSRIKDIARVRYGTDPETLARSIGYQVGLGAKPAISIECNSPFTINVTQEYVTIKTYPELSDGEFINIFIGSICSSGMQSSYPAVKIKEILDTVEGFTVKIIDSDRMQSPREMILQSSNFKFLQQIVTKKRTRINSSNIIPSSLTSSSAYMRNKVQSIQDIKRNGDFFFDSSAGYLELFQSNVDPFILSYIEFDPLFTLSVSEFNLLPINNYIKNGISDNFINIIDLSLRGRGIGAYGSV